MMTPDLETVRRLARTHSRVTIYREIVGDTSTPITLLQRFQDAEHLFLLESARLDRSFSRFSFFGTNPTRVLRLEPDRLVIEEGGGRREVTGDPFGHLVSLLSEETGHRHPEFGDFSGGFVGWFGYEAVNLMDVLRQPIPMPATEPLAVFFQVDRFYLFDNHRFKLYAACVIQTEHDIEAAIQEAVAVTQEMEQAVLADSPVRETAPPASEPIFHREMDRDVFMDKVAWLKQQIVAGECIQAVLSNRYTVPGRSNPVAFYRALRRINPSPYLFLLKDGDTTLCGSSPETHLKVSGRTATLKPIAGTARLTAGDDVARVKRRLLSDPKERAEHLMLLDLARNDLYTCCDPASVQVVRSFEPEVYSHVIHIVSEVTGSLPDEVPPLALFARTFPAGTLTGAPKVRAMELIAEVESSPRGFYGGCVGYVSYAGYLDTCITIRSARFTPKKAELRAGAGIVYDSDPERECDEVEGKLEALFSAFHMIKRMEGNHVSAG